MIRNIPRRWRSKQWHRHLLACTVALITLIVSGCAVYQGSHSSGPRIEQEALKGITPGKSTRQDVLKLFGPPVAVAKWNKPVSISYNTSSGVETVDSDTFFELFTDKHALGDQHIVYLYSTRNLSISGSMVMLAMSSKGTDTTNKLWLLINRNTGMVLDMFFIQGK